MHVPRHAILALVLASMLAGAFVITVTTVRFTPFAPPLSTRPPRADTRAVTGDDRSRAGDAALPATPSSAATTADSAPHRSGDVELAVDGESGFIIAPGWDTVKTQCTVCHSSRIIVQNHARREGWLDLIRWMQATQGLWPLGNAEPIILDYLAKHHGVPDRYAFMRRQPLSEELMP